MEETSVARIEFPGKFPIKFKRLYHDAILPIRATEGSVGLDCVVHDMYYDELNCVYVYKLGFAVEIPIGFVGLVFPRSSVYKTGLSLTNCVGVIDPDYRGEVSAKFTIDHMAEGDIYKIGERCCQLVIVPAPIVEVVEVEELSSTVRGTNGYGSTGLAASDVMDSTPLPVKK